MPLKDLRFALAWPLRCLIAATALTALMAGAIAQPRYTFERTRTVLPKTVVPSHYQLALQADPARERFDGRAVIRVQARVAVPAVVLHAQDLDALQTTLVTGASRRALRVGVDARNQTWHLTPRDGRAIAAGEHRLEIQYRGRIKATGQGLFRARHQAAGRPAAMLATQLQAINARMLFPGFDEPLFRAVFEIEVTAPRGFEVLSNQPLTASAVVRGGMRHRFQATPPMPGYLVAVAVGRFDKVEGESAGVPLRIFTAPGKRETARYAMGVTQRLLPYFNAYFGTPYALPKLDQLAVPGTRNGAMEDWGLISYVEDALLFDPSRSSNHTQRGVFRTVAHEIAHQWFGNLVSVASWDEIWLNEAFATWMEQKAGEHFQPEWQLQLSARGWLDRTMERDATAATRAIRSGPVNEARVFDVFDGITYSKGGAVLTMLEQWVGDAAFQRGLAAYMQERRLAPATAGDLWHHIGQAVGRPVGAVAATWTDQPGFPLIDVSASCSDGRTVVTLRQQRFVMSASSAEAPALWQVPVRLARGDALDTVLLDGAEHRVELAGCAEAPLVANTAGRGFYRVRYADGLRAALVERLPALAAADRVAHLADSHALALAGQQPLARHFDWLAQLPRVTDAGRAPLYALAATQLEAMHRALAGLPAQEPLRATARALLGPELERIGWQEAAGEDPEVTRLRATLIDELARLDDMGVVAAARERFAAAMAPRSPLPGTLQGAVLRAVGHHADGREFDAMLAALRRTDSQEYRWTLAAALARTRDAAQARRLLQTSLAGGLPPDVATELPGLVAAESTQGALAYAFVVAHWQRLAALTGTGVFGERAWLLPASAEHASDRAAAARLRNDQRRLAGPTGTMPAEQIAARIELRAALRERESDRLAAALAGWRPALPR